jgi:hypothetical protein
MTLDEFKAAIIALDRPYQYDGYYNPDDDTLVYEWVSGGQSGGSCWGNEYYAQSPEQPPTLTIIDFVLESLAPTITYLQYRRVAAAMVSGDKRSNDYYGNYTNYEIRKITIPALYEALTGMGYLKGE